MAVDMNEPIAVVGIDLKFPGDASTPENFWEMLQAGRSALTDIPNDRYNVDAFFHPDQERAGAINVRKAHFIRENLAEFDAPFFSISPAEAACMDPQQRGLLESVYRALENAGIPLSQALGSSTSVHVGCFTREYDGVLSRDPEIDLKYIATGTGTAMLSNRLSWFYDFRGPSMTLDTACSSSLLAAHLACTSLKLKEASMAIVAGCNLFYNPDTVIPLTSLGFLSPDGKCYSFDERANGYSRGEGFGILVLKRLSDAIKDQNTIRAIIRNTASNQDGRSPGITQPTKQAQVDLIRQAYESVGLGLDATKYFEAHGTGTPVGDPIEASAISSVFTKYRSPEDPIYIGALKSNIGHLEGAAGIAGLLKSVFVLERGIIPPNCWFENPSSKIPAADWNFKFPVTATVWPDQGLRRASINAFGYGGSNAHVIMDDALHFLIENNLKGKHRTVKYPKLISFPPALVTNGDIATEDEEKTLDQQKASAEVADSASKAFGTITAVETLDGIVEPFLEDVNDTNHAELGKSVAVNGLPSSMSNDLGASSNGHIAATTNGYKIETNGYDPTTSESSNDLEAFTNVHGVTVNGRDTKINGHQATSNGLEAVHNGHKSTNNVNVATINAHTKGIESTPSSETRDRLFTFSAFDEAGIQRLAQTYHDHFVAKKLTIDDQVAYLDDFSHTMACNRSKFTWRSSVVANSLDSLIEALSSRQKPIRAGQRTKLGFVFTGQGAQWFAMGRELLAYPVFNQSVQAAKVYLSSLGCTWSLIDEFLKDKTSSNINDPAYSQPICTVLQIALVELLGSWSVYPEAIVGHSSGEIAAAFAMGAISREAAWKLSYYRGKLSSEMARSKENPKGGMLSVALTEEAALEQINKLKDSGTGSLTVACINSPKNVTISGAIEKINILEAVLTKENTFARKLQVDNAYHSEHMNVIAASYEKSVGHLEPGHLGEGADEPTFYSSLTGGRASRKQLQQPSYWVNNLVSPVKFSEALTRMLTDSAPKAKKLGATQTSNPVSELLEVGPHSALRGPIREIIEDLSNQAGVEYESVLQRNVRATQSALAAAGWLFGRGHTVDITAINTAYAKQSSSDLLVDLPSYPFNHSKAYWNESRLSKGYRFRKHPRHELLGAPVPDWNPKDAVWRNWVRVSENPWIRDHRVTGSTLYPAAGMLIMAIEASRQLADPEKKVKGFKFREVSLHMALRVPLNAEGVETHFNLRPYLDSTSVTSSTWSEFSLRSHENDEWREHCRGLIQTEYEVPYTPVDDGLEDRLFEELSMETVDESEKACIKDVSTKQLYELLQTVGLDFGPTFQNLSEVRIGASRDAIATIKAPDVRSRMPHGYVQPHLIHPTTLDAVFQSILVALTRGGREVREVMVPTSIRELWVSADPSATHQSHRVSSKANFLGLRQAEAKFVAIDSVTRKPMVVAEGFVSTAVSSRDTTSDEDKFRHLCFNIDWKPDPSFIDQEVALKVSSVPEHLLEYDPSELITNMEMICYMYMKRFMNSADPEKFKDMKPHHQRFVAWIKHQIGRYDRGELLHVKMDWNKLAEDEEFFSNLEKRMETWSPESILSVAVGKVLPQILAGEIDPLTILFNNSLAENIYRRGTGAEISYAKLTGYLDALAHKNPGMKILEVGAGTGGATVPILETLMHHGNKEPGAARFSSYDFTDISPSFFEKAKETFASCSDRMKYRVLNIETDPTEQGFDLEQYDLIIGANVIHATRSINNTLQNVRKLLKPGGKLILYELTNMTMIRTGFGFGLLPGWWLCEEPYREWGPLMSVSRWSAHLQRSGFTGVDFSFDDYPNNEYNQVNSVLVSTATMDVQKIPEPPSVVIIIEDSSALQKEIAAEIEQKLRQHGVDKYEICPLTQLSTFEFGQKTCIFLPELEKTFLEDPTEDEYRALQRLMSAISGMLWITEGGGLSCKNPKSELVTGFARTMRAENALLNFITLSVEKVIDAHSLCGTAMKLFESIFVKGDKQVVDNCFFESNGIIQISRIVEANYMNSAISAKTTEAKPQPAPFGGDPSRALKLYVGSPGLLDTLQFDDDPAHEVDLEEGQIEFQVKASALNFLDIMVALGQVIGNQIGVEGAGVVTKTGPNAKFKVGDRVCGVIRGTLNTYARGRGYALAKIPDNLSFVSAASIPVVFVTAYCALYDIANIQKGESVLIHAAAGGVGQACIQLAQLRGAEVYATVGTLAKRDLLISTYGLRKDHIFSSRDLTFAPGIKRMTKGRGVDVVVNALSGAGLRATWDCIAPLGRFVEIGKVDIYSSARLNMEKFKNNVSFEFVDVGFLADNDGPKFETILEDVMRLVREGKITELHPVTVYPFSKLQEAFRYMQSGAHTGKIILEPHDEDEVPTIPSRRSTYDLDPNATYLISGGLGGLGRSMARWMARRGAKNLILLSRYGAVRDTAKELVTELEAMDIKVQTPPCDVTNKERLKEVLKECLVDMPPIKGCIQGSMVLKDAIFANMTLEDYQTAVRPKVSASWNLHEVLPVDLDFFILLSSGSGIIGNRGQANYCVGNAYQDALARHRVSNGLKATVLDLGMILSVGFVAENADAIGHLRAAGFVAMREEEYLAMIDTLCNPTQNDSASLLKSQISLGFEIPETLRGRGFEDPSWMRDPLFRHLYQIRTAGDQGGALEDHINYAPLLAAATTHDAATDIICDAIVKKLCKALTIEALDVDTSKPLHAFGVDSLVAVELRTWFLKELGAEVAVFDMMGGANIRALAALVATRSSLVKFKSGETES